MAEHVLPDVTNGAIPGEDLTGALLEASWARVSSDVFMSGLLFPEHNSRSFAEATGRSVLHWLVARLSVMEAALDEAGKMGAGAALAQSMHALIGLGAYLDELLLLHPATGMCPTCHVSHCQTSRLLARARELHHNA
jgi:hypothetical protein